MNNRELALRWPSGDISFLLPLDQNLFLDRRYWEEVRIERDSLGKPSALIYDHFKGEVLAQEGNSKASSYF